MDTVLTCARCEVSFTAKRSHARYCSTYCRVAASEERARADGRYAIWIANGDARRPKPQPVTLTCKHCATEFTHPPQRGRKPMFCSPRCRDRDQIVRWMADGRWAEYNAGRRGPGAACVECGAPLRTGATRCSGCAGGRPHIPGAVRLAVYERDGWECQLCELPVDPAAKLPDLFSASLDHRVPVAHGGGDEESNLQLAHFICNCRKQDRLDFVA